jgi:hypothetical protein
MRRVRSRHQGDRGDTWRHAGSFRYAVFGYGAPLNGDDLARYAEIVRQSGVPVIAPSQKRFVPGDMEGLRRAGIGAVLVGSIVTGDTPRSLDQALRPLVEAAQLAASIPQPVEAA